MSQYRILPASPEHLEALPAIELAAARLFEPFGLSREVLEDTTAPEEFREGCEQGGLFVAVAPDGVVVGFALAHLHGGTPHLEEIDVHPDHGRRGIGARLVERVCEWAAERGFPALTLTTFRDVPWNEPFYRRLGFEVLGAADLTPALREIVDEEASLGLDPERRVVMRRRLSA